MSRLPLTSILTALLLSGCAIAQPAKPDNDHAAHHGPGNAPAAAAQPSRGADAYDQQMKAMQEMHQKMQAAKTPAERSRLMDEHMKLMQSGMAMMGQMRGAGPGMGMRRPDAQAGSGQPGAPSAGPMPGMMGMGADMGSMHMHMERRMAMMERMMQMMVDREAAMPRQ